MDAGRLFVVATPIGNLEDITRRALRVLGTVDLIAAEDTRHSKRLLRRFDITAPLVSYHDHNEAARAQVLIDELNQGKDIALISDAGTPCVSDPGYRIVRAAHEHGIEVVAVPGPSAAIAAVSISGLPNDRVTFHGFFPRKQSAAARLLELIRAIAGTHVFFESPRRLVATLQRLGEHLAGAEACVVRELTKQFEETLRGTPQALAEQLAARGVKGECVLVVHVPESPPDAENWSAADLREQVHRVMQRDGLSSRDAIRRVADTLHVPRRRVYEATVKEP
ncbi:MAG: 16S rRNA (cytidine(1402)-2'-O)-methyltransferase [Candidatus Hydrogenedentes bacterium]|nr:16S rRNA (cytidine(1402)-2'-O)-methyltransferase [Candidatus Hydrogenedentota bacterium]